MRYYVHINEKAEKPEYPLTADITRSMKDKFTGRYSCVIIDFLNGSLACKFRYHVRTNEKLEKLRYLLTAGIMHEI